MFRFVQWELPGHIGPGTGRYVVRPQAGEGPEQVLVVTAAEAPQRRSRLMGGGRPRGAAPEPEIAEVPVTRATVIEAAPLAGEAEAEAWLKRAAGEEAEATVAAALRVLNQAVRGHRISAADPHIAEVAVDQALVTRVGYGSGDEVADGRWAEALELPPPKVGRRARRDRSLRPQERLAALLGGRDAVLACEELALRGRLDLDHGREREAALQTHLALEAARVELAAYTTTTGMADRLAGLDEWREPLAQAANEALQGGLPAESREAVAEGLDHVERALRARALTAPY